MAEEQSTRMEETVVSLDIVETLNRPPAFNTNNELVLLRPMPAISSTYTRYISHLSYSVSQRTSMVFMVFKVKVNAGFCFKTV